MVNSRRPVVVSATTVLVVMCLVLTLVSWLLHTLFAYRVHSLVDRPGGDLRVRVDGWASVLWLAEPAKLLVVVAAVLLWLGIRRPGTGLRTAISAATAGCALAYAGAAIYDGLTLSLLFVLASLASAANALSGGSGLPAGDTLGLGIASVVTDVVLFGLAVTCVVLLSTRPSRAYLRGA